MNSKVLSLQDYSCIGGSSGSIFIGICSLFDVEPILIPTVLYSCHLGVKQKRTILKTKKLINSFIEGIDEAEIIHIGYYEKDINKTIKKFIDKDKKTIVLDPILSDDGNLFSTKSKIDINNYKELINKVAFITPNFYEACLLLDLDYKVATKEDIINGFNRLSIKNYLVKGIICKDEIVNIICIDNKITYKKYPYISKTFQGCGDVICSAICCLLSKHFTLLDAVNFSLDYVNSSINNTDEETSKYSINYSSSRNLIDNILKKSQ